MRSHHVLGITIALGGVALAAMVIAATNATPDQLDDPVIGDLARDTFSYVTGATAMFVAGLTMLFIPGRRAGSTHARRDRNAELIETLRSLSRR